MCSLEFHFGVYVTRYFATLSWAHTQFASWVYHTLLYMCVTASQWKGKEVIRVCISRDSNSRKVQESKLYWSHISICDSLWADDVNMNPRIGSWMHIMACPGLMMCMRPANERRLCNSHRWSACTEWSLLATCSVTCAYMDRCQFIVNWTPRNKLHSFKKINLKILSVKRHFAPPQCVKLWNSYHDFIYNLYWMNITTNRIGNYDIRNGVVTTRTIFSTILT